MSAAEGARTPVGLQSPDTMFFGARPGYGRGLWVVTATATVAFVALQSWRVGIGGEPVLAGLGLIAAAGAAMLPHGARLSAAWAWGAAAAAALAQFVATWYGPSRQFEGQESWFAPGATIVFATVILRRRAAAGWTCALLYDAGDLAATISAEEALMQWNVLIVRQLAALVAIQVFAVLLSRGQRAVAALQLEERTRIAEMQRREAVTRRRHAEAERIRDLATGTLQRIAAGESGPEMRHEAMLLEGALRDTLRGRRLAVGPVPSAARIARARGVDVVLLDDLGDTGEESPLPPLARDWIATRLAAAAPPRATARLTSGSDGRPELSFYSESSDGGPERWSLGA